MKIVPAVIAKDIDDLSAKLRLASAFSDVIQADFFDDRFVHGYVGPPLEEIGDIRTPPANPELVAHMLAFRPLPYLSALKAAGFCRAIFHIEADDRPLEVVGRARDLGLKVGIAVNPATDMRKLTAVAGLVDEVLLLAVDPGRPGVFLPAVLERVAQARELTASGPSAPGRPPIVSVDGGINAGNIRTVRQSGADIAYVGHAIFSRGDPGANYRRLAT